MKIKQSTANELMDAMVATYVGALCNEHDDDFAVSKEEIERVVRGAFERFCLYIGINEVAEGE